MAIQHGHHPRSRWLSGTNHRTTRIGKARLFGFRWERVTYFILYLFYWEACDIIIKKMILSQSNNINEYNTLINNLNPMGRYQIIIYAIGIVYWMIAGILKTTFDLTYYEFQCPYATALFECFGILLAGHIACWQNRKIALIAMGIISLLGYSMILITCLMISSVPSIRSFGTMGIALIGCSTYSQPLLALCIIC